MQARWLHEWFAFGAFASWVAAMLISEMVHPSSGRLPSVAVVRQAPLFGVLAAVAAAAPLYLRTLLARHRQYHYRFQVPLALGLLHAPLVSGTMWLAEAACRPSVVEAVALLAMLGWPVLLGEVAYRACRTA